MSNVVMQLWEEVILIDKLTEEDRSDIRQRAKEFKKKHERTFRLLANHEQLKTHVMSEQYTHHLTSGTDVEVIPGDSVTIFDSQNKEIVKWIADEWEDPHAVTSTMNAVLIAARYGGDAVDTIINGEEPMTASRKEEFYRRREDIVEALAKVEGPEDTFALAELRDRVQSLLHHSQSTQSK